MFSNHIPLLFSENSFIFAVEIMSHDRQNKNLFRHIGNKSFTGNRYARKTKGFDSIKIYCPSILIGGRDEN